MIEQISDIEQQKIWFNEIHELQWMNYVAMLLYTFLLPFAINKKKN